MQLLLTKPVIVALKQPAAQAGKLSRVALKKITTAPFTSP